MNFIAIATALKALADGSEKTVSPIVYDHLPNNSSGRLFYFIFRSASIVNSLKPGEVLSVDIGANSERRRAEFVEPTVIRRIGDLSASAGLEEYDARNFYVIGRFQPLTEGSFAEMLFYRKDRKIEWAVPDLEKVFPPDAVFSVGKWIKGVGVVPKK